MSIDADYEHLSSQQRNRIYRELRRAFRTTRAASLVSRLASSYGVSHTTIVKVYWHVYSHRGWPTS